MAAVNDRGSFAAIGRTGHDARHATAGMLANASQTPRARIQRPLRGGRDHQASEFVVPMFEQEQDRSSLPTGAACFLRLGPRETLRVEPARGAERDEFA